jgi:hypothetical protein
MKGGRGRLAWLAVAAALLFLAACSQPTPQAAVTSVPAQPTAAPAQPTAAPAAQVSATPAPTSAPQPTSAPSTLAAPTAAPAQPATATAVAGPTSVAPTATAVAEAHVVELEWPPRLRLGDSDLVRLALIPYKDGYVVTTEFPEHQTVTTTVAVARPGGYDVSAVARLDGTGFDLAPAGEQAQGLPVDTPITWRWTLTPRSAGKQRLSVTLTLRWTPQAGNPNATRETRLFAKGFEIQVMSFLGLTARQAAASGLAGLALGGMLSLPLMVWLWQPRRKLLRTLQPNPGLVIEPHPAFTLAPDEQTLLRALFGHYGRLVLEAEFRSGYSGARTFLAQPVRLDGRADAHTIVKIGERAGIQREYENYLAFVQDTLPPITARIQETPVVTGGRAPHLGTQAAVRYTFIAEPGRRPNSLREALLMDPNPALLHKLFDTFGPHWWMQRRPYIFRLAQEYDRMLPAHYVLEPMPTGSKWRLTKTLVPGAALAETACQVGDVIGIPQGLTVVERRADGKSLALSGPPRPGQPPLRVRWLGLEAPNHTPARVAATRETLLREYTRDFDLCGLPDPLVCLPRLLAENVAGTQSTIHGDLNLENVLVGPGGFVWLIDFAQTRDGHPLYDFAHLEAQIIAHVIAPQMASAADYAEGLRASGGIPTLPPSFRLRLAMQSIAARCLFNSSQPREYDLALFVACLGALKYTNLNAHQKHLLYLTAAHLAQSL